MIPCRQPRNWVSRFSTPEALRGKLLQRQLHLIHGQDVARALVLGVHGQFAKAQGQRWIVTDGGCYDWVKLILAWGSQEQVETTQNLIPSVLGNKTIYNLVDPNNGVIIHPRLDSTEFWDTFGLKPTQFLQVPWYGLVISHTHTTYHAAKVSFLSPLIYLTYYIKVPLYWFIFSLF